MTHSMIVPVAKLAVCKKCGDPQVAWLKSEKSGKFYLATAYLAGGQLVANKADPHFKKCGRAA